MPKRENSLPIMDFGFLWTGELIFFQISLSNARQLRPLRHPISWSTKCDLLNSSIRFSVREWHSYWKAKRMLTRDTQRYRTQINKLFGHFVRTVANGSTRLKSWIAHIPADGSILRDGA
ncbi:MAG: hypothetical protein DMG62_20895 [Acidobacteria bacterium]|nr:MAG: hypothetical protein DMG62_20895 [Acidobacteriota bacterium]